MSNELCRGKTFNCDSLETAAVPGSCFSSSRVQLQADISLTDDRFLVCPQVLDKYNPPDHFLPESYTCFFLLKLPRYSCKQVLEEKLKYAIHFCKSIDTDDYARIALSGEPAADDSSEDSDNEDADSFASDSTQDYLTGH